MIGDAQGWELGPSVSSLCDPASPCSPPVPCAASAVVLANLVPGPCPQGIFLKPEGLTASVSLQAEPSFQVGQGAESERGREEREMGHKGRQQGKEAIIRREMES